MIAIINDLHLGVQRRAGTTQETSAALGAWAHRQHEELLRLAVQHNARAVIVNGDLTDSFSTPLQDQLAVFSAAQGFLEQNGGCRLVWALGNHDLSRNSTKLGAVQFLGSLLSGLFPGRFQLIERPDWAAPGVWVIPHLVNQDYFDAALSDVPETARIILLHCNYDNPFAVHQDHSLNLSQAQAKRLAGSGRTLVIGHEHQGREELGGSVVITGNQFPTSVADCLQGQGGGQANGTKRFVLLDESMALSEVTTWTAAGEFVQVDWKELDKVDANVRFIRVTGDADGDAAAAAVKAISKLRQTHEAFVIVNAVRTAGANAEDVERTAGTVEDARSMDVLAMLLQMLDPQQRAVVEKLIGEAD